MQYGFIFFQSCERVRLKADSNYLISISRSDPAAPGMTSLRLSKIFHRNLFSHRRLPSNKETTQNGRRHRGYESRRSLSRRRPLHRGAYGRGGSRGGGEFSFSLVHVCIKEVSFIKEVSSFCNYIVDAQLFSCISCSYNFYVVLLRRKSPRRKKQNRTLRRRMRRKKSKTQTPRKEPAVKSGRS